MTFNRCFLLLILSWSVNCFSFEATHLLNAIERRDSYAVISFFDQIDTLCFEEAHEFISNFYDFYIDQYGSEILHCEEYLNKLDYCKELYHAILKQYGFSLKQSLIHDQNNVPYEFLLCGQKENEANVEVEVPGSMILGGVEILGGVLVWILPFPGAKELGVIMIGDGIRRTFNGVEEADKENKKNQLFQSET